MDALEVITKGFVDETVVRQIPPENIEAMGTAAELVCQAIGALLTAVPVEAIQPPLPAQPLSADVQGP